MDPITAAPLNTLRADGNAEMWLMIRNGNGNGNAPDACGPSPERPTPSEIRTLSEIRPAR